VDCAVFGFDAAELKVLLIRRKLPPFQNRWALPVALCASRRRSTTQLGANSPRKPDSIASFSNSFTLSAPSAATRANGRLRRLLCARPALGAGRPRRHRCQRRRLVSGHQPPLLAFDHAEILATALRRLRAKVRYQPIGFELLPPKFTLSHLQHLYEAVLETEFDKRNFRKRILSAGLLVPLSERVRMGAHRPAQLFRFDTATYEKLIKRGFNFEL
jgi:8-oxo-dGTP diphosphatase